MTTNHSSGKARMIPTRTATQSHVQLIPSKSATSTLEKLSYWLTLAYLASQTWGIPVLVLPGVNWALWPLLPDLVWLLMLPIALILFIRGIPRSAKQQSVILAMGLFVVFATISFLLAWLRFNLPNAQIIYFAFNLLRLFEFFTVWFVASAIPLTAERQKQILATLVISGIVVSITALLEQFGLLDYRLLVSHLPSDETSGAWAIRTLVLPDAALGTLNYNRIYTGHFLVTIILAVIIGWQFSLRSVPVLICLGVALLATQSRTAFIPLAVGVGSLFLYRPQLWGRMAIIFFILALGGLVFVSPNTNTLQSISAIETRSEDLDGSLTGRFERQLVAVDLTFEDEWTPLIGIGLGNLGYFWLGGGFSPSHGQYTTTLAEMGVIGLGLFLNLMYRMIRNIPTTNSLALAIIAILLGNVASAFFNDLLMPSPAFGHYLGLLYCLAGLGHTTDERHENSMCIR